MRFGEKNVGTVDKAIRIAIGVALVFAIVSNMVDGLLLYLAALAAVAMFGTAILGTCGLYSLLGINTCEPKKTKTN